MVGAGDDLQVAGHAVGFAQLGGLGHDGGVAAQVGQQFILGGVVEQRGVERVFSIDAAVHSGGHRVSGCAAGACMRVLDVEHRVLVAVLLQELGIQRERGVRREPRQRITDGVLAQPGNEVLELDDVARAFGQLGAVHRHELADQDLNVGLGIVSGGGGDGLQPVDVAVVVCSQQVDLLVVAAVLLGQVVRGIRGEVGRFAVRPDHHPVLVVTEVRGAQPDGTAVVEHVALLAKAGDGTFDGAGVVQLLLREVDVKGDAEVGEGVLDVLHLRLVRGATDHRQRRDVGQFPDVRVFRQDVVAQLGNVLTGVTSLRHAAAVQA
ncbi:hypothetical protein D9M72_463540 [compost metagenome]